jgi:hypothetical protein
VIAVLAVACTFAAHGQIPDPVCAPGASIISVTQANVRTTICRSGWSSAHRNVSKSTKRLVYRRYDVTGTHPFPQWEVDHLVPLELGGSNSVSNGRGTGPASPATEASAFARPARSTMRSRGRAQWQERWDVLGVLPAA